MAEPDALVKNAGSAKQVAKAGKKENARAWKLEDSWKKVLALPEAVEVFGELLNKFHAFKTPFDPNPNVMAFQCGEQNVAHYLMTRINDANPQALLDMRPDNTTDNTKESDDNG